MAKGKASGKIILLGEHFVVPSDDATESTPALAFPLQELWCEVSVTANHHPHYTADVPEAQNKDEIRAFMARAVYAAADCLRLDAATHPLRVESKSNFPVSRGFGSSAAFAVALARALDDHRTKIIDERANWEDLERTTSAIERIFHGRPSGIDAATILAGRPVRFENGKVVRELANRAVDIVAVDSGSRDHCATLVKGVMDRRKEDPARWNQLAGRVRELVESCERALAAGDAARVADAVREAQGILAGIGLSTSRVDALLDQSQGFGALAGKVSGAGGGGAVVLVARPGEGRRLSSRLQDVGVKVLAVLTPDAAKGPGND